VKTWLGISLVAAVVAMAGANTADASYCGAARYRCCKPTCCQGDCASCKQQCCTVMKICEEVTYEEKPMTVYETAYEDVPVKKTVDTTKFVDDKEPRIVSIPICQTKETPCPQSCCDPCAAPKSCVQQVTVPCLQRVPVPVVRGVPAKEEVESTRIVEKKTPKTVICLIPHVKRVEVPVQVCCPMPCCCCGK
jgi:hypothetical protein